jgi:SAM-dependent methyltransferase
MASSLATRLAGIVQKAYRLPLVYRIQQRVAEPTTSRFRALLARHVRIEAGQRVLDIACGIGNYRDALSGRYYGCDINAAYIETARQRHAGQFDVMDCCHLTYADGFFDHVVSIAATHHLDDAGLAATMSEALRVCGPEGSLHVIDGILPVSGHRRFKRLWFALDAGRFPRTREQLRLGLTRHGRVELEELVCGPLHDCVYFRVRPRT